MTNVVKQRFVTLLKRFGRSDDGATAVEFALVAAPFLFVFIVMFELGIMLFAEYGLAQNVESAGRLIRTGQIQNSQNGHLPTAGYFKTQICGQLNALLDCNNKLFVDVRKFNDFSDISGNLPNPYKTEAGKENELSDDITTNTEYQPGVAGEIVSIRVYYDWKLFVPDIISLLGGSGGLGNVSQPGETALNSRLLSAAATFRNEPFTN